MERDEPALTAYPDVDNGQLVTRYFKFADIAPQQAWDLLEWCARHGADEFTITAIVVDGDETKRTDDFFEALDQYQLSEAQRRTLTNPAPRVVPLWRLSAGTIRLLQSTLPNGYDPGPNRELWLEDLNVYRAD